MYIEVIILLNSFLVILIVVSTTRLLMVQLSYMKLFLIFLSSLLVTWHPILSLLLLGILIFQFFATNRKGFIKFLFLSAILLFTTGGVVEFVSVRPMLLVALIGLALLSVRMGKSLFIVHHANQFIKEVTCGPLKVKGYWDSGNQCTDPLSAEPVHFIHQDLIDQYPELFAQTKRLLSLSTVTSNDLYPLYEIREPFLSGGNILVGRYVAPVKTALPFESQLLLHHYAFQ